MTINEKMSEKFDGLAALIGHTPMLEISLLYKGEPRIVYAKAEYYNYSGSIKDRVAAHILRQAYETGAIADHGGDQRKHRHRFCCEWGLPG